MPPDPAVAAALRDKALRYLARYAASKARLARIVERRARRLVHEGSLDAESVENVVASVVDGLAAAGLVDDRSYAETRTRALLRRGRSTARIRATLATDGITRPAIDEVLAAAAPADGDLDRAAAVRYARRRGLGPFRDAAQRAARRERDLRALLRQGFALPVARSVIDAETVESLEDVLV